MARKPYTNKKAPKTMRNPATNKSIILDQKVIPIGKPIAKKITPNIKAKYSININNTTIFSFNPFNESAQGGLIWKTRF